MEYSVSKAIQKLTPTVSRQSYPKITSTPARTIITPGIGHVLRNFSVIVPLTSSVSAHEIVKLTSEPEEKIIEQTGSGKSFSLKGGIFAFNIGLFWAV